MIAFQTAPHHNPLVPVGSVGFILFPPKSEGGPAGGPPDGPGGGPAPPGGLDPPDGLGSGRPLLPLPRPAPPGAPGAWPSAAPAELDAAAPKAGRKSSPAASGAAPEALPLGTAVGVVVGVGRDPAAVGTAFGRIVTPALDGVLEFFRSTKARFGGMTVGTAPGPSDEPAKGGAAAIALGSGFGRASFSWEPLSRPRPHVAS